MSFKAAIISAFILFFGGGAFADTIVLKSGKEVQGKVLEKTDDYVKIDYQGAPLYYEKKYIQTIKTDDTEGGVAAKFQGGGSPERKAQTPADIGETVFMRHGLELASQGKFDASRKVFYKGLASDSSNPNFKGALTVLDDLSKGKISEDFALSLFKGSSYLEKQNYVQASDSLEEALRLKPGDPDVSYNLAIAYQNNNREEDAIKCLRTVIAANQDDAEAYSLLGTIYYSKGDYVQARENFDLARGLYQKKGFDDKVEEIDGILEEFQHQ
jgi:tetratricopeptide (TPR) repeat protein